MTPVTLSPFFIEGSAGRLFSLYFGAGQTQGLERVILFFPPFAEELNKSRRMIALQARRFAAMGYGVLVVDYYGTGDSEGDFGDATWDIWQQDIDVMMAWLAEQGAKRVSLWGLRFGALMALHAASQLRASLDRLLLWQPIIRGDQMMGQFLRLRLAADMIGAGNKVTVRELREQLAGGDSVEVAGYVLSPTLVKGVDGLNLQDFGAAKLPPIEWLEVVGSEEQSVGPASQKLVDAWRERGIQVNTHTVVGAPFWLTPEISTVPSLLEQSSELLQEMDFDGY